MKTPPRFKFLHVIRILAAMNAKTEVFWVVTPCSLVYVHRHSRGTSCFQISGRYVPHSTSWQVSKPLSENVYILATYLFVITPRRG